MDKDIKTWLVKDTNNQILEIEADQLTYNSQELEFHHKGELVAYFSKWIYLRRKDV